MEHGKLYLIGMGPGDFGNMTHRAAQAIRESDVLCGYTAYIDLVREMMPEISGKRILTTPMHREIERCQAALREASEGKTVAMICSGDAGIYGMAGPVLELQGSSPESMPEVEIIPGITAAVSGAAVLGAPLMNDFCVISLSDLLTGWDVIERRLRGAAMGDLTAVIYNPMSKRRTENLRRCCEIFLEYRPEETPCGWVRNIGRGGQEKKLLTLGQLRDEQVDMFTTVFIGNSSMKRLGSHLITPRGYDHKNSAARARTAAASDAKILLFGGTTEGRRIAKTLSGMGFQVCVCVATETGAEYLNEISGLRILTGRKDTEQMAELMSEGFVCCIDATHPYAVVATANIRAACRQSGLVYHRLLRKKLSEDEVREKVSELVRSFQADPLPERESSDKGSTDQALRPEVPPAEDSPPAQTVNVNRQGFNAEIQELNSDTQETDTQETDTQETDTQETDTQETDTQETEKLSPYIIRTGSAREACTFLMDNMKEDDHILLTTGAREAAFFTPLLERYPGQIWIRVLPSEQSIQQCLDAGFPVDQIITGCGPYETGENVSILNRFGIDYLVTKDGGIEGGYPEKLAAAVLCRTAVITIRRPEEDGLSEEELLRVLTRG